MTARTSAIACALIVCGFAAPVAAQTKDERAKALIGLARVKRDTGDADAARRYFEDAAAIRAFEPQEREEYFWVIAGRDAKAAIPTGRAILAAAPGRDPVRDCLIGLFVSLGDESAVIALAADGERLEPGVALWPRRLGQSALRTGNADVALAAFERAQHRTGSTSEDEDGRLHALELRERSSAPVPEKRAVDPLTLIELQIQGGDPRAGKSLESWIDRNGCSQQTMTLADRMRDPEGTAMVVRLLNRPGCPVNTRWIERGIERTVAAGKHATARELLARLPAASASQPAMRRLAGQLALWTGHPAEAITTLEIVVRQTPGDRAARASLVDAYRAVGRSQDAWAMAEPLMQQPDGADRLLSYADLALEAGKPEAVPAIVARVPQSATVNAARVRLIARAHLAAGRPADAYRLLEALTPAELDSPAALALLDSAMTVVGPAGALASARRIAADTPAWRDVVARQYVIEALAGDPARAKAKRAMLAGWDPRAAAVADAEVVGAAGRLLAVAPSDESRARIETIASVLPNNADVALLLARTRALAGDHTGALAALGPAAKWDQLSIETRRVAADSLRALGRPNEAISVLRDTPASPADSALLAELHASIGRNELASGHRDAARVSFERAVALDSSRTDGWNTLAELAANEGADGLSRLTDHGAPAEAVATFHLTRARTFAAAEKWDAALGSVDAVLAADAGNLAALRLRAEVLSWSGRHADGLAAYDIYLARKPDDVEAARQQARVFGWAGQFSESKRRYAQIIAAHPGVAVVAAEADAKSAFFDGRWNAAADAYGRWLTIEPDNGEAAFERAESLRAAGHLAEADAILKTLATTSRHQSAAQAWDRVQTTRQPAVSALTDSRSTNGYGGSRLLDTQAGGAGVNTTLKNGLTTMAFDASYVRLSGGDASRRGYRVGGAVASNMSAAFSVHGQAKVWSLDNGNSPMPEFVARLDWRPIDRWTIGAGSDRSLLFENIVVVDSRLAATGAFGGARFESSAATFDVNVGWHHLSDGNQRMRATVTYGRQLAERLRDLRLLVWAESLNFNELSADYYSPAHQMRADAGLQYTHDFRVPKFRQDLRKRVTMGYLVGTDSQGVLYHHPTVNLTLDFANGLALVARGDWIQSDVYTERSILFGFTVTPGARR